LCSERVLHENNTIQKNKLNKEIKDFIPVFGGFLIINSY